MDNLDELSNGSLNKWIDLIFEAEQVSYWIEGHTYPYPFEDCLCPVTEQ